MNDLSVFENAEFGKMQIINRDREPWFVATDVCRGLELGQTIIRRPDEDERTKFNLGRQGGETIVNESGLYALDSWKS